MDHQFSDIPLREKISPATCLGGRTCRPYCRCCGGVDGVRAAFRKTNNSKKKTLRTKRDGSHK